MKILITLTILLTLHRTFADMELDDLNDDSYTRRLGDPASCPDKIRFNTESRTINADDIRESEDADCTGSAQIVLSPITNPQSGIGITQPVRYLSSRIGDVETFWVGRNTAPLPCGPFTFPAGLQWIFFNPDEELDDVKWSSIYGRTPAFASDDDEVDFDDDERYLLIGDICFYEDTSITDRVCFPSDATTTLENGSVKTMDSLTIGDRVHVGNGIYSDVFAWTHKTPDRKYKFIQLTTEHGNEISATPGHYIYADGKAMQMKQVRVGMSLRLADGSASMVVKKENVFKAGLYNPQTHHGDIVIDGVVATTYTAAVQPETAHALLAPVRAAFKAFGTVFSEQASEL